MLLVVGSNGPAFPINNNGTVCSVYLSPEMIRTPITKLMEQEILQFGWVRILLHYTSLPTHTLILLEMVMITLFSGCRTQHNYLCGITYILVTVDHWQMLMLSSNSRILLVLSTSPTLTIIWYLNSVCTLEVISITTLTVVKLHVLISIWVQEPTELQPKV